MTHPAPDAQVATIRLSVNGTEYVRSVPVRKTLADFLRQDLALTGTHVGCEHGVCGACTIHFDGEPIRSCLMLAVQADGARLTTVEGLGQGGLGPLQEAFAACHALQCGFCTPGMLMSADALLRENPRPTELEIREALAGNLCRCTGYHNIVEAVRSVAEGAGAPMSEDSRAAASGARPRR